LQIRSGCYERYREREERELKEGKERSRARSRSAIGVTGGRADRGMPERLMSAIGKGDTRASERRAEFDPKECR
jgi:hypothetical protein